MMSGTAPSPKAFGGATAQVVQNSRSQDQMAKPEPGAFGQATTAAHWWEQKPKRVGLDTVTGQNLDSTKNAFDTDWWANANEQEKEQKTLQGRWKRPDATGVVTYDSEREGVKFGDVFTNGVKQGNMYEGYNGMTKYDSDAIMGRLVLDREVWAKAYETEAGKPLTLTGDLRSEIDQARIARSRNFEKGVSASEFEAEVSDRALEMEGSGAWEAANIGTGVAGGALSGAGLGTLIAPGVGTVIGGVLGAAGGWLGSYLNRDEAYRSYAQALEQWESATEDGHQALGIADAAGGLIGGLAGKLNVTRNLLHGGYDAAQGVVGDQKVAYQDTETPLWLQGADMAALIIDGVGSFGTGAARKVYTGLMGATSAAGEASVVLGIDAGNYAFNPYTGAYEDIGTSGMAQRQASVGIDIAQTGASAMIGRVLGKGKGPTSEGGWVVSNVDGTRQATRLGFSALIPSEAVTGLGARTMARRSIRNLGLEDNATNRAIQTARQLENLSTGKKTIAVMALNGFGEGAEEFVQAAIGATAFGELPTFRELVEASKQGFGMGVGMGAAIGAGSRSRTSRYLEAANTMRTIRGEALFTEKEWGQFTESEQAQAGTANTVTEKKVYNETIRQLVIHGGRVAVANIPELQRATEVARSIVEQQQRNSQELVEPSRLQVRSNHEWGAQDYVVSLVAAMRDVESRQKLMAATAKGDSIVGRGGSPLTVSPEERAQAGQIAASDAELLANLQQAADLIEEDPNQAGTVLGILNSEIQRLWSATDDLAYGKRRSASVWGARYPLNSAGSFQLLRLQISPELTLAGANNTVMVPDEILAPTGGDFDGDRFVSLLRELLPETSYQMQRWGAGQLTSDGTMLDAKPYLNAQSALLFDSLHRSGLAFDAAVSLKSSLRMRLNAVLAPSGMPVYLRRKLVNELVRGLENRDTSAVRRFFGKLSVNHAQAMRQLAQENDSSPWLTLNRVIEDEMRQFADVIALTTGLLDRSGQLELPEASSSMPRSAPAWIQQTSEMLQGAMDANKFDIFRLQTVLKYNSRREATTTSPEESSNVLADLFRKFTAKNDGIVRPGELAMFDNTLAQDRTITWLTNIANEFKGQFSKPLSTNEALVMLAGANVSDDDGPRAPRSEGGVRLIQAVLHEVVTEMRAEYGAVLGKDATIASRLNSLDALTRPNFEDGSHTHAQGGDAFVEVLGAYPIIELLGEQGANLNGISVLNLRNKLVGMRWDSREEYIAALKRHNSYPKEDDAQPSAYRVLVDNIIESARMQLTENRETGQPEGSLNRTSAAASKNFKDARTSLRKIARARGVELDSPKKARNFLASDVRLSEAFLALVEERGVRVGTIIKDSAGVTQKVHFPVWVYDVLSEKYSDRAEMMLLRETLTNIKAAVLSYNDKDDPDELEVYKANDRIVRLWLDLDFRASSKGADAIQAEVARDAFLNLLTTSTSTEDFIAGLNLDRRFRDERTPPFMVWARDRSVTEDSRFGTGVSDIQDGASMRDAMRDAAQVAATVLHDEEATAKYLETNRELLDQLRRAKGDDENLLWQRFTKWFELSKDLPTMVGVSVWINQAAHINEILGNMGVKGISPENVASMGSAIAAQLSTYDSATGRLFGSMTSGSVGDVLTDPTLLARGERTFVLNDGTVVNWDAMTPERAVDLLSDPDTAGIATRMLGMTAWDYNEDLDRNVLVSIVGKGVAGFTAAPDESLFGGDEQSKFRRLMTLESMATTRGGPPIIPMILAEQMNIREAALDHVISDKTGEREKMAVQVLIDIADALDQISRVDGLYIQDGSGRLTPATDELTGEDTNRLNQILLNAARKAQSNSGVGNSVSKLVSSDPALREIGVEIIRQWGADYSKKAVASGDETMMARARKIKDDIVAIDDIVSPLDVVLNGYQNFEEPLTRARLLGVVQANGDIVTAAAWAAPELLRLVNTETPQSPEGGLLLPALTNEEWETVARAVIAFTMHTTYGAASTSNTEVSVFPSLTKGNQLRDQRSFWDPTFVEPMLNILVPGLMNNFMAKPSPLLAAQLELTVAMNPQHRLSSMFTAEAAVYKLVEPIFHSPEGWSKGTTGDWNALLPALMHSAQGAVLASTAESAVKMAGLNPERLAFLAATTKQDWSVRPDDSELSQTSFPADQLIAAGGQGVAASSMIDVTIAGWTTPQQRTLAQMEGRVVRQLGITVAGQRYSLLGDQRYGSGLLLPVETEVGTSAAILSVETLQGAISSWLRDNNIKPEEWGNAQIDVSFFHPDTKSISATRSEGTQYNHSPWFDGVGARTDAAFAQQSLAGGFFFGLDGATPTAYARALGAIKKLTFALQQVTEMPEFWRRTLIGRGLSDMTGMLDQLTEFAMLQPIDGDTMDPTSYNAVRKIMSLLYVVRYIDETGPHVISSEEAIRLQMQGTSLPDTAEVIGLPMQHVLRLMGEQGASVPTTDPTGDNPFTPDVSLAQQYLSFPPEAWTAGMFGGFVAMNEDGTGWGTTDMLDLPVLQNQSLPSARVRSHRGQTKHESKDFYGPYRKHQAKVLTERGLQTGAQTKWAGQRSQVIQRLSALDANIGKRVLQGVQAALEGRAADAASLMTPAAPNVAPTNDFTTGWMYVHHGDRLQGSVVGTLHSVGDVAANTTLGDDVIIEAATFIRGEGDDNPEETFATAREVLREIMAQGATIHLPRDGVASSLRTRMAAYLRENNYAELAQGSGSFVPQPTAVKSQQTAAFNSTLSAATKGTSVNRVLLVLGPNIIQNENSIYGVNGGLGALETYDLREVVQTGRYANYGPQLSAVEGQRLHLINELLPILRSTAGKTYLAGQSGVNQANRAERDAFALVLNKLEARLVEARNNPRASLIPDPGEEFGTGDLIPLVAYNERQELIGIHLYRHGHKPVAEKLIVGAALPAGNGALPLKGVRLTIDQAAVDPRHTAHEGTIVERDWRGQQGFLMRIRTALADLGSKVFEVGTGMKWTTTVPPKNLYVPKVRLFGGKPVLGAADIASPAAKTADGGWLNTPSRIIEAVGFDVMPHLVRLIKNIEYTKATAAEYTQAANEIRDALGQFRAMNEGSVTAATLVTRSTDDLSAVLRSQIQAKMNELLVDNQVDLNASGTETRLADIKMAELVLSSLASGAHVGEVLGAPGYLKPGNTESHTMHPVFTSLLHQLPNEHPARKAFVAQINSKMPFLGNDGFQLRTDFTWTQYVTAPNGDQHITPVMLAYPEMRATDTNDALTEQATGRKVRADVSGTTLAMAYQTADASPLLDKPLDRGSSVFGWNPLMHGGEDGARRFVYNPGITESPITPRLDDDLRLNRAEARHIYTIAMPRRRALSVPIDSDRWYADLSAEETKAAKRKFGEEFAKTRRALGFEKKDSIYLVEMIRSVVARPATAEGEQEYLKYRETMGALKLIQTNAARGDMPTHGGAINIVSRAALDRLKEVDYKLRAGNGKNRPVDDSWNSWVDAMLSEAFTDDVSMRGYPAVSNIIDGLLYEYRKDVRGMPVTVNSKQNGVFAAIRTRSDLLVASPMLRRQFDSPSAQDGDLVFDTEDLVALDSEFEELPQQARKMVDIRLTRWEKERGLRRKRQSPRREAIRGAMVRDELTRTNMIMRFAQLGIVLKTMVNPGLWTSAFVELAIKGQQERAVSFLAGENLMAQQFTPAQRQQWKDTLSLMAEDPRFYGMVYTHTNYTNGLIGGAETRVEEKLQRFTNMTTAMLNDPTWGTSAKALAQTFLEGAWDSVNKGSDSRFISIEQFLDTLVSDPEQLASISRDAVEHAYARVEYRRNLQDNLLERMRRAGVEKVINSGGAGANTLGTLLLRFPTLFFRFRSNTIINMLGLQGAHATVAALMSDRTKRPGGLYSEDKINEQARIEDSYDLTRAFIRTGVSHTQLMMLGMALSAMGLGGADDEERMLNKLRRFQKPIKMNDPTDLKNDFRNAEAWFAERLPAGMGVPSWVIRPFVSPAMGIARFSETGDLRQVFWGFMDALGNLPLLNVDNVVNSWNIAHELAAAADAKSLEKGEEATAEAGKLLFTTIGVLESMLFESSFASLIYQAADEWDRDPYKKPELLVDGTVATYGNGEARPSKDLDEFVDPETGEIRTGYVSRNDWDARLHGMAENRPVLAFVLSKIMHDSSFIRYNMVPKLREVDAAPISLEEAKKIVVSITNHETGAEEVTLDGAAGVIRGIHLGTVRAGDPALDGIFIDDTMRNDLQRVFLEEFTNKYINYGDSPSEALSHAKAEYYGQAYGEPEATGIADILWGKNIIPKFQTQSYMQLNTTYVMGPNGQPIATGLQRSVLDSVGLNPQGLGIFQTYEVGDAKGGASNMNVDSLLNNQDAGRGINLGQRGLVKVDETWITKTPEEIEKDIESALDEIGKKLDNINDTLNGGYGGYGNGFRGYGSGGGGGGGGYGSRADYGGQVVRLNTPRGFKMPFALDPHVVSTSNPIIRRATVRRERFSSDRGRLNQWQ